MVSSILKEHISKMEEILKRRINKVPVQDTETKVIDNGGKQGQTDVREQDNKIQEIIVDVQDAQT